MPKDNRARTRAARALMGEYQGLTYTQALAMLSPARPEACQALLVPYPDEVNVDVSQLGWRILLPGATPAQKATAEAIWEPVTQARPCRCSGPCRHGGRCGDEAADFTDGTGRYAGLRRNAACEGRLVHTGRVPQGILDVTEWLDTYACRTCNSVGQALVTLPGLPWGRLDTSGRPGITITAYPTGHLGAGTEGARIEIPLPGDAAPKMARGFSGLSLDIEEADRELRRAVTRAADGRQDPEPDDAALAVIRPLWPFVTAQAVRYILARAAEDIVEHRGTRLARDIASAIPSPLAAAILTACVNYVAAGREEQPGSPPGVPHDVIARRAADDPAAEQETLRATAVLLAAACSAALGTT
jgi:hypothetical protein